MLSVVQSLYPTAAEQAGPGQGPVRAHRRAERGPAARGAQEGAADLHLRPAELRRLELQPDDLRLPHRQGRDDLGRHLERRLAARGRQGRLRLLPAAGQQQCRRQRLPGRQGRAQPRRAEQREEHRRRDGVARLLRRQLQRSSTTRRASRPPRRASRATRSTPRSPRTRRTFEPAWDTIWIANTKAGQAAARPFNWEAVSRWVPRTPRRPPMRPRRTGKPGSEPSAGGRIPGRTIRSRAASDRQPVRRATSSSGAARPPSSRSPSAWRSSSSSR